MVGGKPYRVTEPALPIETRPPVERSFDAETFRRALGQYPTGVTVVTAFVDGRPIGMTANSFTSVSLDPPLVLWCVGHEAMTHDAFGRAATFAVHVLGAEHEDLALTFAGVRGPKFEGLGYRLGATRTPLIDDVAPVFECRTWARYPGGDHTIMVGEVEHLVTRPGDPLLFHSGVLRGF